MTRIAIENVPKAAMYLRRCLSCGANDLAQQNLFCITVGEPKAPGASEFCLCRNCMSSLRQEVLDALRGKLTEPVYAIVAEKDGLAIKECTHCRHLDQSFELEVPDTSMSSTVYKFGMDAWEKWVFHTRKEAETALPLREKEAKGWGV